MYVWQRRIHGRPRPRWTYECTVFALAALVSLVLRLPMRPVDGGGLFFQFWCSLVGLAYFAIGPAHLARAPRRLADAVVLPIACALPLMTIYFAPQALFPFMFLAAAIGRLALLWSEGIRERWAAFALVLAVCPFLMFWALCYVGHMVQVSEMRNLRADQVTAVVFPDSGISVTDRADIARITDALSSTTPYSPNHESIRDPRRMEIQLRGRPPIRVSLGKGNSAKADIVWVQFGVEVYMNAPLYKVLVHEMKLPIWQ